MKIYVLNVTLSCLSEYGNINHTNERHKEYALAIENNDRENQQLDDIYDQILGDLHALH